MSIKLEARDYSNEIESVKDLVTAIQTNVNFNLALTWSVLGVIVGVLALSSFFSIKSWFNKRFNEEAAKIDQRIYKFVRENPQVLWAKGNGVLISSEVLTNGSVERWFYLNGLSNFKKENIIYVDVYYIEHGKKVSIENEHINIFDDGLKFRIIKPYLDQDINTYVFLLWSNPFYK